MIRLQADDLIKLFWNDKCCVDIVDADALVLKHQGISSHNAH